MSEISDLLERTTPSPPPFDVAALAHKGRRRHRRAQLGAGLGAIALLAGGTAGVGLLTSGDEAQVLSSRPPTGALAEAFAAADVPLGSWEQLADPPFSPRMSAFTGTAADGRVVVWGGTPDIEPGRSTLTDGGVYDPASATWEAIPPAPVSAGLEFSPGHIQLAGGRLMVLGTPMGFGPMGIAVYDLDDARWTAAEPPPTIEAPAEGIAWTGETLALVRFWSGSYVGETEADEVASYIEPVVERWSFEDGVWAGGAAPPLSNRFGPLVAFDGEQLAAWGGARHEVVLGSAATGSELMGDGAIYDVAADRWEAMAPGPLQPRMQGTAMWQGTAFVAAGGFVEGTADSSVASTATGPVRAVYDIAAYHADERRWSAVPIPPGAPEGEQIQAGTHSYSAAIGGPGSPPSLVFDGPLRSGPHPVRYFDPVARSWLDAPLRDLRTIDGSLVATSLTPDNPGDGPFGVQVLAGSVWEPATGAPFVNRMDAGVAVVGEDLFVVGGAEGPDLQLTGDAWVLRFDP